MDVFLANEQDLPVDEAHLARLAGHVLASEQVDDDAELSVLLVTEDHIRQLNARYAGEDHSTDVLAFPLMEDDDDPPILGDVVICPAVARRNSARIGHDVATEMDVLMVHGILHLLGYDHQDRQEGDRMERRLNEIIQAFRAAAN